VDNRIYYGIPINHNPVVKHRFDADRRIRLIIYPTSVLLDDSSLLWVFANPKTLTEPIFRKSDLHFEVTSRIVTFSGGNNALMRSDGPTDPIFLVEGLFDRPTPCQRCGELFVPSSAESFNCILEKHSGKIHEALSNSSSYYSEEWEERWSCCDQRPAALGCRLGEHLLPPF